MTYEQLGQEIGALVEEKQRCYGSSFSKSGQVMSILYPQGVSPAQLDDALTVVRVLDKLFRIATDRDALGESPWRDIAGYALLSVKRVEDASGEEAVNKAQAQERKSVGHKAAKAMKRSIGRMREAQEDYRPHVGCRWCGQNPRELSQFCSAMCRRKWEDVNGVTVDEAKP